MTVYPVLNTSVISDTVSLYLSQASIKPPLKNPTTLIPKLIQCKGIIHYTRSGTRTVVNSENYKLKDGDFLVVAAQCKTGANYTIPATFQKTDYAFIMGKRDGFFTDAKNHMDRRPAVINKSNPKRNTITKSIITRNSFEEILKAVSTGKEIVTPINDVLIVSHARGEGMLFFRLNANDPDKVIYLDELCPFAHSTTRNGSEISNIATGMDNEEPLTIFIFMAKSFLQRGQIYRPVVKSSDALPRDSTSPRRGAAERRSRPARCQR